MTSITDKQVGLQSSLGVLDFPPSASAPAIAPLSAAATAAVAAVAAAAAFSPTTAPEGRAPLDPDRVTPPSGDFSFSGVVPTKRITIVEPCGELSVVPYEVNFGISLPQTSCIFEQYLSPNEQPVEAVQPHLARMARGWIVSTGTERSLFNLILAPLQCEGVIIRDINWKVKALMDFTILLLRISENRKEFVGFFNSFFGPTVGCRRKRNNDKQITMTRDRIVARIKEDLSIPEPMKNYYLENIDHLIEVYTPQYSTNNSAFQWRLEEAHYVNYVNMDYFAIDEMFKKLKKYAQAGRIIATVGDINDLHFLDKVPVTVVDASNICDYVPLTIHVEGTPLVIWTLLVPGATKYYSFQHRTLHVAEKERFDRLLIQIGHARRKPVDLNDFCLQMWFIASSGYKEDIFNAAPVNSYTLSTLHHLQKYCDTLTAPLAAS